MPNGVTHVQYGRDETFRRTLEAIGQAAGEGVCVLFVRGSDEQRREALAKVADFTSANISQRDAKNLIGENFLQTQGNIREAFDMAGEAASLLYLANADAIFENAKAQHEEQELNSEAQTGLRYLFQRIDHYSGIIVLHVSNPEYVALAAERVADFVVEI